MKVTALEQKQNEVKLTVEIPTADVEKYFDQAIKQINQREKFEGFRPGHAPRKIIETKLGTDKLHSEVIKVALNETYPQAIKQAKITPITQPQIQVTKFAPHNPFQYTVTVSTLPEVKLGNYQGIKITKSKPAAVNDKEVEAVVSRIQKQLAEFKEKKTEAKKGDKAEIDFEGFLNNVPLEDAKSKNHPLIIGEGIFVEGFEDQLVGMKPGETKEFSITFPKNHRAKHLAGNTVKFKVKLHRLWDTKLPKIDDEFAKKINPKFNLAKLKEDVKQSIQKQKEQEADVAFKSKVIEKVVNQAEVVIPPQLIEEELETMINEVNLKLAQQGSSFEKYLESIKKTREDLKKEWRKEAEKRIKTGLVIAEIAKQEKIDIPKKEIELEVQKQLLQFMQAKPEELKKIQAQLGSERSRKQIELTLRNRKAIEKLAEYATKS